MNRKFHVYEVFPWHATSLKGSAGRRLHVLFIPDSAYFHLRGFGIDFHERSHDVILGEELFQVLKGVVLVQTPLLHCSVEVRGHPTGIKASSNRPSPCRSMSVPSMGTSIVVRSISRESRYCRNAKRSPFVCVLVWVYFEHERFESGFRDLTLCVKVFTRSCA